MGSLKLPSSSIDLTSTLGFIWVTDRESDISRLSLKVQRFRDHFSYMEWVAIPKSHEHWNKSVMWHSLKLSYKFDQHGRKRKNINFHIFFPSVCLLLCIHTLSTCLLTPNSMQNCWTAASSCFWILQPSFSAKLHILSFWSCVNLVLNLFFIIGIAIEAPWSPWRAMSCSCWSFSWVGPEPNAIIIWGEGLAITPGGLVEGRASGKGLPAGLFLLSFLGL